MIPGIGKVEITPSVLTGKQTDVAVTAEIADSTGIIGAGASLFDPSSSVSISEITLTLTSGSTLSGIYSGTMVIPLEVRNGLYQTVIRAANSATRRDQPDTMGIDNSAILRIERLASEHTEPTEPHDSADTNEMEKYCCKVTINVTAGPVNIYVCSLEKQTEIKA